MASEGEKSDSVEENILYDLTIHAEWAQEPEVTNKSAKDKLQVSLAGRVKSTAYRSTWTFLRSVGVQASTASPCSLPAELVKLISSQLSWHFVATRDGKHVAVLQDQFVEIRSSRDDYASVVSKFSVGRDLYPQWRQLAWSPEGDMLAMSDSSGKVLLFDIMGTSICTLANVAGAIPSIPVDLSNAVVSLIFREYKGEGDWSVELIVVNYQGGLRSYVVNRDGDHKLRHEFVFSGHYPQGVSSVVYHDNLSMLLLGGCADPDAGDPDSHKPNTAMQHGITAWRILSDIPHYKLVTDYEQDLQAAQKMGIFKRLKRFYPSWQSEKSQDGIYQLRVSPNSQRLAAVHYSGAFSLWHLPSLRLVHYWPLDKQPDYDKVNTEIAENPKKRKAMKEHLTAFGLVDSNWWSEQAVILARGTGAVTVSSALSLANLLGVSPEWFEPGPRVSAAQHGGFLGLECECKYSSLKRRHTDAGEEQYEDSDDEEDVAMVTRATRCTRQLLYYVTDSEKFQPPRKKPKLVTRTYRLVCLKSTTPEELYTRKIDNEEYGEALLLAKTYGLDCDLVYQRQWRKTPVSVASIQDYLSKISKRSWVLHECLERVPENIDAMRELLQYGLRGTDLEALIAIGQGQDGGRFILCDSQAAYEQSLDVYDEDAEEDFKLREKQRREQLLQQVNFNSLTLEQKALCTARLKLLEYHDRLSTYEEILGGLHAAEERFDPKFFEKFRSLNIVEIATDYARNGDAIALDILFTYHTDELSNDRLAILANFSETLSPEAYKFLLPVIDENNEVVPLEKHSWRDPDWCELQQCKNAVFPEPVDLGRFLYEECPDYEPFRGKKLTDEQVGAWYSLRSREVERLSRSVDHASLLVQIAMHNNIKGLEKLRDDLETMETLVYQCYVDDNFSFADLEKMSDIDKLRFMMDKSNTELYPKNIRRWLLPFLERCEKREPGSFSTLIREYIIGMAKEDLTRCRKVFEASKADVPNPVIKDNKELMSLALDCIYACDSNNQLGNAFGILECLPQRGFGIVSEQYGRLHNKIDELEAHLGAAEILESNGIPQTITFIKDTQDDKEKTVELFTKLTRTAGRKTPPLNETAWRNLLCNLLDLRDKVYRCVPSSVCYEIFVESLLCSGRHENINLARAFIEQSFAESQEPEYPPGDSSSTQIFHKVAYSQAIQLVLSAAREYFDSSANLTDPCMDLARAVLGLIKDEPMEIKEEVDLIESLVLLDGFAVQILPVQVRMCENRLELIKKALEAKPVTYRNTGRLLKLAKFLRVSGANEVEKEGQVLRLVTQFALKEKDFKISQETCKRMIELGYSASWEECKLLAEHEEYNDIHVKADLLCFAVTHCSSDMIEPILRAKCLLETKILYDRIHRHVQGRDSASPAENPISAKGALQHTREILTSTTKTTRAVLSTVTDKKWWKNTLKSLHRERQYPQSHESQDDNEDFERQACHPFYQSLIPDAFLNTAEGDYCNMRLPKLHAGTLDLSEAVLRASKQEETVTTGESHHPADQVLLHLAQESLSQDTLLGLAYLLSLPKALDAEECFSKNPHTAVSLQIAAYYYALQIYVRLIPESQPEQHSVYTADPTTVIAMVAKHVTAKPQSEWPDLVKDLVPKLKHYEELLMDYTQAQVLQGLGRGVDIGRFTKDNEYKHETILGLAMTGDPHVYDIAVSLAKRYKLSLWEVYMTHLEYLFDSGLGTEEIEQRMRDLAVLGKLQERPGDFHTRMYKYVYPSVAGTEHGRLIYFYTLLGNVPAGKDAILPDQHIRLLKKIKSAAPGLDYKKLMSGEHRALDVVQPVLNTGNVHVIAKLASKIPDSKGGFLQPSLVFCAWATKVFWHGESGNKKLPENSTEWLHRYEQCGEYIQKMSPSNFLDFIDGIIFVPDSIKQLGLECRQEICKRALKLSRQQPGKKKSDDSGSEVSWSEAADTLQSWMSHLDKSNCQTMQTFRNSDDEDLLKYADKFDLSKGQQDKLEQLLMEVLIDGQLPDVVLQILDVCPVGCWTPRTALVQAIQLCIHTIRDPSKKPAIFGDREALHILRILVQVTSEHNKHGGDLLSLEDVMGQVRPFCSDSSVKVQDRLDTLQIVEQSFELSDEDLSLLTLYRTDAIVAGSWPSHKVEAEMVTSISGRQQLYQGLLTSSKAASQFSSLAQLLNTWPSSPNNEEDEKAEAKDNAWYQLFEAFVKCCGEQSSEEIIKLVQDLQQNQPLPQKVLTGMFELFKQHNMSCCAVKCLLISEHVDLYDQAVQELSTHTEVTEDEELLLLILQRHLVSSLVDSVYYTQLVSYIIEQENSGEETVYYLSAEEIANQLSEAGYEAHAGSLLLQAKGTNEGLRTFHSALHVLSSWFGRNK